MKRFLYRSITLPIICLSALVMAQDGIDTDRPDQSDGVATVPKGKFQIEEGVTFGRNTIMNNLMLRYGITNSTEIRLLSDEGREHRISGFQPLTLSVKQKIAEEQGWQPAVSAVGYLIFGKLASRELQANSIETALRLAFENGLSEKFSLGYNIGSSHNFENLDVSAGVSYSPAERWSTFVEYFSTFNGGAPQHNADAGILFGVLPRLQLDLAAGHSLFSPDSRFYVTSGISYLFK